MRYRIYPDAEQIEPKAVEAESGNPGLLSTLAHVLERAGKREAAGAMADPSRHSP
jgi:hypothetical protein